MSFQDVGRGGRSSRAPQQQRQGGGYSNAAAGGAFSSAAAANNGRTRTPPPPRSAEGSSNITYNNNNNAAAGYEQVSDSILQYQKHVALLERMSHKVGTPEDTSVLQTQYTLQIDVIQQLGSRIETQLSAADKKLSSLSRADAAQSRATHVKLSRDYRMVEQKFKHVMLDVKKRRSLAEARVREARMEEERRAIERNSRGSGRSGSGGFVGGGDMTDEGMRWQMQIQEDVSFNCLFVLFHPCVKLKQCCIDFSWELFCSH